MLEVQKHLLSGKTLDDLTAELAIKQTHHPFLPLVILNYNQIESPKTNPIVKECRGLTLHSKTFDLISRGFLRFYNWGEVQDEMPLFDFSDFLVQEKCDGSLCIIYYFDGQWRANTRGSFAEDNMQFQDFTWQQGFCKAIGIKSIAELNLDTSLFYVCEFCSPWNKVVRQYSVPTMFLLTCFRGEQELTWEEVDELRHPFQRPEVYHFTRIEEIESFLHEQGEKDPTFEGVVIRDRQGHRWKCKSSKYLALHRMKGNNGDNLFNPKNLLPFIMDGEGDELLVYFNEVREKYFELKAEVDGHYSQVQKVWAENKHIESQKDFALSIKGKTPFVSILFNMRKKGLDTKEDLREEWRKSEAMILKVIT
jgi:hypothetical protein